MFELSGLSCTLVALACSASKLLVFSCSRNALRCNTDPLSMVLAEVAEQQSGDAAQVAQTPRSLRGKLLGAQVGVSGLKPKRDTYGRTVMPPKKEKGDGPFQLLHTAANNGNIEALKALLESPARDPADLEGLAKFGWSPLMVAARAGHAEAVQILTRAGASLTVRDHKGSTALHRAAYQGNVRTIEALVDAGAPLEQVRHCERERLRRARHRARCACLLCSLARVPAFVAYAARADGLQRPDSTARSRQQWLHEGGSLSGPPWRVAQGARRAAHRRRAALGGGRSVGRARGCRVPP